MRISAVLHPAVIFALPNGAGFLQDRDGPSVNCADHWPFLLNCQNQISSAGMNPQSIQLFQLGAAAG
jgi:hypothetical protein